VLPAWKSSRGGPGVRRGKTAQPHSLARTAKPRIEDKPVTIKTMYRRDWFGGKKREGDNQEQQFPKEKKGVPARLKNEEESGKKNPPKKSNRSRNGSPKIGKICQKEKGRNWGSASSGQEKENAIYLAKKRN